MKYYYIDTTFSALLSEHTSSGCEYIEAAWKQDNTSSFHGSGSVWLYIYWAADTLTQSFCFQDFWIISKGTICEYVFERNWVHKNLVNGITYEKVHMN